MNRNGKIKIKGKKNSRDFFSLGSISFLFHNDKAKTVSLDLSF